MKRRMKNFWKKLVPKNKRKSSLHPFQKIDQKKKRKNEKKFSIPIEPISGFIIKSHPSLWTWFTGKDFQMNFSRKQISPQKHFWSI